LKSVKKWHCKSIKKKKNQLIFLEICDILLKIKGIIMKILPSNQSLINLNSGKIVKNKHLNSKNTFEKIKSKIISSIDRVDKNGNKIRYLYDANGNILEKHYLNYEDKIIKKDFIVNNKKINKSIRFENGIRIEETNYDEKEKPLLSWEFEENGEIVSKETIYEDGIPAKTIKYVDGTKKQEVVYIEGNIAEIISFRKNGKKENITKFYLDLQKVKDTDLEAKETLYYNELGEAVEKNLYSKNGIRNQYIYNPPTILFDSDGNADYSITTHTKFLKNGKIDFVGKIDKMKSGQLRSVLYDYFENFIYDKNGKLKKTVKLSEKILERLYYNQSYLYFHTFEEQVIIKNDGSGIGKFKNYDIDNGILNGILKLLKAHDLLERIEKISLIEQKITDLSFVNEIPNLTSLNIPRNPIKNFSPLSKKKYIESLDISNTGITDLSFLESMKHLEYLNLSGNNIEDISIIEKFPFLRKLKASKNTITKIPNIKELFFLNELDLSYNKIKDISNLRYLFKKKQYLDSDKVLTLNHNQIKDISAIINLKNMNILNLNNNQIKEIPKGDFEGLGGLRILNLNKNKITDISNLKSLIHKKKDPNDIFPILDIKHLNQIDNSYSDKPKTNIIDNDKYNDIFPIKNFEYFDNEKEKPIDLSFTKKDMDTTIDDILNGTDNTQKSSKINYKEIKNKLHNIKKSFINNLGLLTLNITNNKLIDIMNLKEIEVKNIDLDGNNIVMSKKNVKKHLSLVKVNYGIQVNYEEAGENFKRQKEGLPIKQEKEILG